MSVRDPRIDHLRGLCILSVMALHYNIRFPLNQTFLPAVIYDQCLGRIINNGYMGVVIFFVISGYLITRNLQARFGSPRHIGLRRFYVFRFGRIMPELLGVVALLSGLDLGHVPYFEIDPTRGTLGAALLSLAGLRFNLHVYEVRFIMPPWDVLWSLTIEEVFYLAYPILCRALGSWRPVAAALMAVMVICPIHRAVCDNLSRAYDDFSCFDLLALGCLTAILVDTLPPFGLAPLLRRALRLGGFAVVASVLVVDYRSRYPVFGVVMVGLGAAAFILGGAVPRLAAPCRAGPPGLVRAPLAMLRSFGVNSYEIYITHCIVINTLWAWYGLYGFDAWLLAPILFIVYVIGMKYIGDLGAGVYTGPLNRAIRHWA
jgi:peptidoglycan/LPS O-acetylase OafA/YrhL